MKIAEIVIPCLTAALIIYALFKKVNVYKAFLNGAAEALPQLVNILPALCTMLCAIEVLKSSGALDHVVAAIAPFTKRIGLESELVPLIILRPFSGSASLALLRETLLKYGADSHIGRAASVLVGSTETVFYTTAVYFGAVGVTKTRHALPAALISGLVGIAAGLALTG